MDRGGALAALALDRPFALVRDYVLVPSGHCLALDTIARCVRNKARRKLIPSGRQRECIAHKYDQYPSPITYGIATGQR